MAKSEGKELINIYAKQTGKPAEEIAAEIAHAFGYSKSNILIPTSGEGEEKLSPMMRAIIEAKKMESEMGATGKGEVSPMMKMMIETITMMPLMKMMGGMDGSATQKPQENIMDLLAKNDEKWEKRVKEITDKQKEDALQARLDKLETLIAAGVNKKDDPAMEKILAEVKETKIELKEAEKLRNKDLLAAKDAEFGQYKEDMAQRLDAIENREPPKSTDDMLYELAEKQSKFEKLMIGYGKTHGWNQARIDDEIGNTKSPIHQLLSDLAGENGVLPKLVDAWGKRNGAAIVEQPEIAQPEAAHALTCGNCHGVSNNGTDWCDPCRIQYSNDVVAAQQKAQADAAQNAPIPQQPEAEARAKGEIPTEAQPEKAQQA